MNVGIWLSHGLDTLRGRYNVAAIHSDFGPKDEALKLLEEVVAQFRKRLGPEHHDTLIALQKLATTYDGVGRREEALRLREEVLRLRRKLSGPEHPDTLVAMNNVSFAYSEIGRAAEALKMREELLPLKRKVVGPEHPETIVAIFLLASSYDDDGRLKEATALYKEALPLAKKGLPPNHAYVGQILSGLGLAELKAQNYADAEPHLREGMGILEKTLPKTLTFQFSKMDLGTVLLRRDEYVEAEKLLQASFAAMKRREWTFPPARRYRLIEAVDRLIELYTATNKPDEITKWRKEKERLSTVEPDAPRAK